MPGPNRSDWLIALRGFCMGAADIVPGVSGGTVALILGVYQRLLAAISHIDGTFLGYLRRREWVAAINYADLRFLAALGMGIAVAIVTLAKLMHYLLENHLSLTYAAFFGLILGSSVLVGRMCRATTPGAKIGAVLLGLLGAGVAFGIVSQDHFKPIPGLGYTFFSGAIAICAMILPGVSGSYLLIMLGKYHEITGIIKELPKLNVTGEELLTLVVFALGCLTGLLVFSRVLKWLLHNFWTPTMAVLCGFMVGSLYKIWPFQLDTTPDTEKFKEKIFEAQWPTGFDGHTIACLAIAMVAFALVLVADALGKRRLPKG